MGRLLITSNYHLQQKFIWFFIFRSLKGLHAAGATTSYCVDRGDGVSDHTQGSETSEGFADGSKEVLVKWKVLADCDSTWDTVIDQQFLEFHLEDKVKLVRG